MQDVFGIGRSAEHAVGQAEQALAVWADGGSLVVHLGQTDEATLDQAMALLPERRR